MINPQPTDMSEKVGELLERADQVALESSDEHDVCKFCRYNILTGGGRVLRHADGCPIKLLEISIEDVGEIHERLI